MKPSFRSFGVALLCLAFVVLSWANRTGKFEPAPYPDYGKLLPVTGETVWPEGAATVSLGTYVERIYDFSVQSQAFCAEGWVWLTWSRDFQAVLEERNVSPADLLNLVNMVQTSNFGFTAGSEKPVPLPDGRFCQTFKFFGKFAAKGLNFRRFPFSPIRFPLTFGLNPELPFLNAGRVRLVADGAQSGLGEYTAMPGYVLTGQRLKEAVYEFPTSFGLPVHDTKEAGRFGRVELNVNYAPSITSVVLQLFLPLVVVMAVVLLAPNLAGSLWDVRIALPSTALLTLIFLQQGYRAQLPALPYLTFIDQIYTLCYATSLTIFALFVWSSNLLDQAPAAERPAVIERINRIDRRFQVSLTLGLLALVALAWLFPVP